MFFAELHGKLGAGDEKATERSEDLLTSTVLGTLRYLPVAEGIGSLFARSREVTLSSNRVPVVMRGVPWLDERTIARYEVEFWPRLGAHGEVDAIIRLFDRDDKLTHILLIEAKYRSPKSRRGPDDDEAEAAGDVATDPDQLVDYWLGGQKLRGASSATVALVYLTAHGSPPMRELGESLRRCPTMRLAWLSWRDAYAIARAAQYASSALPARDLAAYLAHKGLSYFDGFHTPPLGPLPRVPRRFGGEGHFSLSAAVPPGASEWDSAKGHFWRR